MKIFVLVSIFIVSGCGVRLPNDFEYNLRAIADINEEMLLRIESLPVDQKVNELKLMIQSDINDFRNAAATVEAGR